MGACSLKEGSETGKSRMTLRLQTVDWRLGLRPCSDRGPLRVPPKCSGPKDPRVPPRTPRVPLRTPTKVPQVLRPRGPPTVLGPQDCLQSAPEDPHSSPKCSDPDPLRMPPKCSGPRTPRVLGAPRTSQSAPGDPECP